MNANRPFYPLITQGDIAHIHSDVIVYSTGCFLSFGYLTNSLVRRYGKDLQKFLKTRLQVGKRPRNLPPKAEMTAADIDISKEGGVPQGFTEFVPAKDLRSLPGADFRVPAMVVAVAGGEYVGHITPVSVKQLVLNVFDTLAESAPRDHHQIVVFPTIGIGKGGAADDRLPFLRAQIDALNKGYQKYPDLVPVLLSYSDIVHHLALTARSQVLSGARIDILDQPQGEVILSKLQQDLAGGRLVIFAGAGISQASGLPGWQELIKRLADKAGIEGPKNNADSEELLQVAEKSRALLGKKFGEALQVSLGFSSRSDPFPSLTHYLLASLPVEFVVTTNYDELLERALRHIKKSYFTIHSSRDVANAPTIGGHTNVLKLHGDFNTPQELVLTTGDYENFFHKHPAVSSLLKGLLLNRTFLFVGYSLRDPNLHAVIDEVSSLLKQYRRPAYAMVFGASEEEIAAWQQRGVHLLVFQGRDIMEKSQSLWQFLDMLQLQYFAAQRAWLAKDAGELLPPAKNLLKVLEYLQLALQDLQQVVKSEQKLTPQLADFAYALFDLGGQHGLQISPQLWEKLAHHYRERQPPVEINFLKALNAVNCAYSLSEGRLEETYEAQRRQLEKYWRSR